MKRWKVIRPPIYIDAFEILEVGDICADYYQSDTYHFRKCKIDAHPGMLNEFRICEYKNSPPLAPGMLVNYNVALDDYCLFDPAQCAPGVILEEVEIQEGQQTCADFTGHIRL